MGKDEKPSWLRGPDAWLAEHDGGSGEQASMQVPPQEQDPGAARPRMHARNVVYAARKHASRLHDVVMALAILACVGSAVLVIQSPVVGLVSLASTIAWWALASAVVHILRLLATIAEK